MNLSLQSRISGALLSLACGDALGAPLEFLRPDIARSRFGHLTEMVGNSTWAPGEWTDDTAMTLVVARAIVSNPSNSIEGAGQGFLDWAPTAKDVGSTTNAAFRGFRDCDDWFEASRQTPQARQGSAAGNGSLMRILPIALAFSNREEMLRQSALHSAMTHFDPQAEVCCALYCLWIANLLNGEERDVAWHKALKDGRKLLQYDPRTPGPAPLPMAFWQRLENAEKLTKERLQPSGYAGYCVETLESAVWNVLHSSSIEECLVETVNLAGEADTMGAVAGGAAGAYWGVEAIPVRWLAALFECEAIEKIALDLGQVRRHLEIYSKPTLPTFEFNWLDDQLCAGRNPLSLADMERLKKDGITHLLDLREAWEWTQPKMGQDAVEAAEALGIKRLHLPVVDTDAPRTSDFDNAFAFLDDALRRGGKVFIHCRGGMERTAAIVAAVYARQHGLKFDDALVILKAKRAIFAPLPGQVRAAMKWLGEL